MSWFDKSKQAASVSRKKTAQQQSNNTKPCKVGKIPSRDSCYMCPFMNIGSASPYRNAMAVLDNGEHMCI